jgi:hypothetical protein
VRQRVRELIGLKGDAHFPHVYLFKDPNYYRRLTLSRYHSEIGIGKKLIDWLNETRTSNSAALC